MQSLKHLARYESAGSGLAFRRAIYGPDDDARLVSDCLALANAELDGQPRHLFLGVDDVVGGERRLLGIGKSDLVAFRRRLSSLLADTIEPKLRAAVRAVEIDGCLIGHVCLEKCLQAPYLTKRPVAGELPAGVGFVRRGARNLPLQREDLKRMFAASARPARKRQPVRIGFPGREPLERIALPVLGIRKLPSELAAERLRAMLETKQQARDIFGRTETRFSRLMHARLYGVDTPFEKHSDESLRMELKSADVAYRAADDHYRYEVRAHRVNLMIVNDRDSDLANARLRLTLPCIAGIGIAERIYVETDDELPPEGYPSVTRGGRTITVEAEIGTLYRNYRAHAFREPPRLWAREEAAGSAVPIDYELSADELAEPIRGSLAIYIEKAALKSV